MMKILSTAVISIFFMYSTTWAQGFNSRNGRNHPELQWRVAETEHFKIMYPEHIAGIEKRAAPIAEESYRTFSQNLGVTFKEKIRIYLSDEDEISNGFAVPIGNGYTNIWVNLNDYADTWTGEVKWLRKVIAHELAHVFHFKAVKTNMGLWQYSVADPLPGFWTEGIAQYQTEKWDSQRGDRWLRLAVFDDRLSYNDNRSIINGRLRYAVGNSQLRFLTETYGDTTLAEILGQRDKFLRFFEYHDFYESFRKVTGKSYNDFYEEWRKHVNIYYNTLASHMQRVDSLDEKLSFIPGRFIFDVAYSPDESQIAVLSQHSMERPVRRLYLVNNDSTHKTKVLAEGGINDDLAWSPDGNRIVYSRRVRGENGSLVNDLHLYDIPTRRETRLTHTRRARYPAFDPAGNELAFVANEGGTANIYLRDIDSGEERPLSGYTGDVQLLHLVWNRLRNELVYHRFDEMGHRNLVIFNIEAGHERIPDEGNTDNRKPVIAPFGRQMAFTSLRDEVPNVFIYDFETDSTWRVTSLFAGGEVTDWLEGDEGYPEGRLVIKAAESKSSEAVYLHDALYRASGISVNEVPEPYTRWRGKTPPSVIPYSIDSDPGLIERRYPYRSFRNLTHAVSLVLPWYEGPDHYGITGFSVWNEPLGKHVLAGGGFLSFKNTLENSHGVFTYVNNQLFPTLTFSAYRMPGTARWYQNRFLVEELTGAEISASWPLGVLEGPYWSSMLETRLRHLLIDPYDRDRFTDILPPEKARQTDLRISWILKEQRPWKDNLIHPVDGYGVKLMLTGSEKILGAETAFLTPDVSFYKVFPSIGLHRIYAYGRIQVRLGDALPQDYIGFSRYDNIDFPLPDELLFLRQREAERVRGYRSFTAGKGAVFGSLEYRIPVLPSLNTRILGLLSFGTTTLSLFGDAGSVWDVSIPGGKGTVKRLGLGAELKNVVRLGPFSFVHALGLGQPYDHLFGKENYDLYYRIKASVPF